MSAAKDVEIWDNAIQAFEAGLLQDSIDLFNSMATISSKISFNIGSAYIGLNDTNNALKSFQDAIKKDAHSAIACYMSGICYYKESRYVKALEQFDQTIKCMRGNKVVDYKQLGLKYQVYECEVLMNKAVIYSKQGDIDLSRDLLLKAVQAKVEKKHEKIKESLQLLQVGRPLEPILPAIGLVFKPSAHAVKNLKKKDYLGQAKVLYTSDPTDDKAQFSGVKLMEESRDALLTAIRKPGRKETLRRISAPPSSRPTIRLGRVVESKPASTLPNPKLPSVAEGPPPRKPLPKSPEDDPRFRADTWTGRPKKPLPKGPLPGPPQRPSNSPSFDSRQSKWDGQRSENSAFRESSRSPVPRAVENGRASTMRNTPSPQMSGPPRPGPPKSGPPKKPLPSGPANSPKPQRSPMLPSPKQFYSGSPSPNNDERHTVDVEVQFSFSMNLKCHEDMSLQDLKKLINKQSLPSSLDVFYVDGLGRQKKLTTSAFDHILQGSIDHPKLMCFPP